MQNIHGSDLSLLYPDLQFLAVILKSFCFLKSESHSAFNKYVYKSYLNEHSVCTFATLVFLQHSHNILNFFCAKPSVYFDEVAKSTSFLQPNHAWQPSNLYSHDVSTFLCQIISILVGKTHACENMEGKTDNQQLPETFRETLACWKRAAISTDLIQKFRTLNKIEKEIQTWGFNACLK